MSNNQAAALGPYRVLDLTDEKGWLCGKILGDLGADVIKIEKPGGDAGRNTGPFYHDIPDPQKSLDWFAFNTSKRGITLDIETGEGRELFKGLAKTADFIIESFPPGHMEKLGLGYAAISKINPAIIMTSITPFGQTGPHKDYKSCDLVALAMSGMMYLTGDPDRAPLRIQPPQTYLMAGGQAAVGSLIAHYRRQLTGEGQHVDVSIREGLILATLQTVAFWHLRRVNLRRSGPRRAGLSAGAVVRQTWPCKDGWITFLTQGGKGMVSSNQALADWINEAGMSDDYLRSMDWNKFDMATSTQAMHDSLEKPIGRFFLAHTRAELYEGARKRDILLAPINTPGDILADIQLKSRAFWMEVEHPELGDKIIYPGGFARMSLAPCRIRRRAPLTGEHNREIYEELALSSRQAAASKPMPSEPVSSSAGSERKLPKQALQGLKVVDFSWMIAAPLLTKYLADHGATVVRIESKTNLDTGRVTGPKKEGPANVNSGGMFAFINSNKYSFSLNLKHPEGVRIARQLIAWGDVFIESFAPGTMEKWGFTYEALTRIKPDIIMLQSSMLGQTGPHARDRGFGLTLTGFTGFTHLTGWPDRGPTSPYGAYTDLIVPLFGAGAILSALEYRRRTGKGQYIDLSQYEAGVQFATSPILDYVVNGREGNRVGNRSACAAPHAAYRCRGDDRWCAVAVFTGAEWEAFGQAIGGPGWTKESRFSTLAGRKENEDELDKLVEAWAVTLGAEEVMNAMQSHGIAAGVVQTAEDLLNDPQLSHRNYFWWLEHGELGLFPHAGQPFSLSGTPAQARPSPCLGEHTEMVCKQILGLSDGEFTRLLNAGVFD